MMKPIILCADDFALNPSVSKGILELVEKQRLSAVSCMTTGRYWEEHSQWLATHRDTVDIGLHFNLTEGTPLTKANHFSSGGQFLSLGKLLLKSHLRLLKQADIEVELEAQLDRFEQARGHSPDFIDGHQHIHNLPVISNALLNVYNRRFRHPLPYIRCTTPSFLMGLKAYPFRFKTLVIALSGGLRFKKDLDRLSIPHNTSFSGIYNFSIAANFIEYLKRFFENTLEGGLVMCHPGQHGSSLEDPIALIRSQELKILLSEDFVSLCESTGVKLSRFMRSDNIEYSKVRNTI